MHHDTFVLRRWGILGDVARMPFQHRVISNRGKHQTLLVIVFAEDFILAQIESIADAESGMKNGKNVEILILREMAMAIVHSICSKSQGHEHVGIAFITHSLTHGMVFLSHIRFNYEGNFISESVLMRGRVRIRWKNINFDSLMSSDKFVALFGVTHSRNAKLILCRGETHR